ncbi:hypothetical protein D9757_012304 [Collybiopsis confluens]|uniref:Kinase-like protein n=1 Tax=Collybiopsis confluens TaxID=2823264 RepID=A0A8H5G639_9AGAR|nr:hypothetical protein D9757_012304 [Collybiopsis confluens]
MAMMVQTAKAHDQQLSVFSPLSQTLEGTFMSSPALDHYLAPKNTVPHAPLLEEATATDVLKRALAQWIAFRRAHSTSQTRPTFDWLAVDLAQRILDELQEARRPFLLDKHGGEDPVLRNNHVGLLRFISWKFQILPSSLTIQNVEREGGTAVTGGGCADIWRGTLQGNQVCLKVLRIFVEQDVKARDKLRKEFCREALIWRQLRHPNILPLLGVSIDLFSPSFCLISSWMENKDIITYLKQNPDHDLQTVLSEVASGLRYMHSMVPPLVHGDIKGANILVTDDCRCCLADFGLSVITTSSQAWTMTTSSNFAGKGTVRWLAPEYLTSEIPNRPSRDIYAFGCTILEIFTRKPPFSDRKNEIALLSHVMGGGRPDRPQDDRYSDALWDLTTLCWAQNVEERPSANQIHEFLKIPRLKLSLSPFDLSAVKVELAMNGQMQPLDRARFEDMCTRWCLAKNIVYNPHLLLIDNRTIDLYQLYFQVMREGGLTSVTRRQLWPIIGGRLNTVHFPGSANEDSKSGPAAAIQIQYVYNEYLSAFDTVYVDSVMDSGRKAAGHLATSGQFLSQGGGREGPPPNAPTMSNTLEELRKLSPTLLDRILNYAGKPASELRARGIGEVIIKFFEGHRPLLQKMAMDRDRFRNGLNGRQSASQSPANGNQPGSVIPRPSTEQLNAAQLNIHRLKSYQTRSLPMRPTVEIAPELQFLYKQLLEMAFHRASQLEVKLHVYSIVTKREENTKRLLTAVNCFGSVSTIFVGIAIPKICCLVRRFEVFDSQLRDETSRLLVIIQRIARREDPVQQPGGTSWSSKPFLDHPSNIGLQDGQGTPPGPSHQQQLPSPSQIPQAAHTAPDLPLPPITRAPSPAEAESFLTPSSATPVAIPTSNAKVKISPIVDRAQLTAMSINGVKRPREDDTEAVHPLATPGSSSPSPTSLSSLDEPFPKRLKTDSEGGSVFSPVSSREPGNSIHDA